MCTQNTVYSRFGDTLTEYQKIKTAGMRKSFSIVENAHKRFSIFFFFFFLATIVINAFSPWSIDTEREMSLLPAEPSHVLDFPRRKKSYVNQNILSSWWLKYCKNDFKNKCTVCGLENSHVWHVLLGNSKPCLSMKSDFFFKWCF